MITIAIIITVISLLLTSVIIYSVYKLNIYISQLEDKVKQQIELTQNLHQSLKEVVAEEYLQNDGRLKKFIYQKERNTIYNGVNVDENITL